MSKKLNIINTVFIATPLAVSLYCWLHNFPNQDILNYIAGFMMIWYLCIYPYINKKPMFFTGTIDADNTHVNILLRLAFFAIGMLSNLKWTLSLLLNKL